MVPNHARYHLRYTPLTAFILYVFYARLSRNTFKRCITFSAAQYNPYMSTQKHYNNLTAARLCLSGALFVALTFVKLLLPEQTAALRAELREAISRDADYSEALLRLGSALGGADAAEPVLAALGLAAETPAPSSPPAVSSPPEAEADAPPSTTPTAEPTSAPTPEPTPQETPAAVAAFLESQAEFSDYAVPASVTYDMPELPFEYTSPVEGYTSSGFGYRLHPLENEVKFHYGTDFAAWTGTDILAFADGTVGMAGWDAGYGNYLVIDHGGGWRTLYAHCSELLVSAGESVTKGQRVALVGGTGHVTGPHLHLELTCDGVYYNPEFYLA